MNTVLFVYYSITAAALNFIASCASRILNKVGKASKKHEVNRDYHEVMKTLDDEI